MKNKVEKLIDGTKTLIIVTDKGIGLQGKACDIMGTFGVLVHNLVHEMDVNEEILRECVEIGIKGTSSKDKEDELDKYLEEMKGLVEKLSSDDKDKKDLNKILKHMEEINKMIKEI